MVGRRRLVVIRMDKLIRPDAIRVRLLEIMSIVPQEVVGLFQPMQTVTIALVKNRRNVYSIGCQSKLSGQDRTRTIQRNVTMLAALRSLQVVEFRSWVKLFNAAIVTSILALKPDTIVFNIGATSEFFGLILRPQEILFSTSSCKACFDYCSEGLQAPIRETKDKRPDRKFYSSKLAHR